MNLKAFSVYDSKAEAYMQPFFMKTKGEALRAFMDTVGDSNHPFHRHAEDYTLFYLGEFDDSNGEFSGEAPQAIARAHELLAHRVEEAV